MMTREEQREERRVKRGRKGKAKNNKVILVSDR